MTGSVVTIAQPVGGLNAAVSNTRARRAQPIAVLPDGAHQ